MINNIDEHQRQIELEIPTSKKYKVTYSTQSDEEDSKVKQSHRLNCGKRSENKHKQKLVLDMNKKLNNGLQQNIEFTKKRRV